jgi:hypothetical protein
MTYSGLALQVYAAALFQSCLAAYKHEAMLADSAVSVIPPLAVTAQPIACARETASVV